MTIQSSKYSKFLAGAASAALVATAIVPTALAAEVETAAKEFSDVAPTHTHYGAIMQAVERGLFNGYTDGTFKPENTIDRKGVVKSLANYVVSQSEYKTFEAYVAANKLAETVAPFNDVPATHGDKELFNASLIVKDSGIFTGSNNNLMPANVITRQQMAKVLVNGFDLKDLADVESKVTDNDKAQAEYVDYINILSENGVTEVTAFNPTGAVKRGQMASFLNRSYDVAHPEEVNTTPEVVSVSAVNAKELVVTFNQAVDATDAAIKTKYAVEGETISNAVVSEDGKTVTLTTADELKVSNAKVTVSPIKTKADATVLTSEFNKLLTFADTTPVDIKSVEAKGTTAVITFDEPVQSEGTVSLDGVQLASPAQYTLSGKTLTITGLTADKSYKVDVVGATDFANNISNPIAVNFTVAKPVVDNSNPTVSTTVNGTEITFDFSEELSKQNLDGTSGRNEYAKVTVGTTDFYLTDANIKDATDKTKFTVDAVSVLGGAKFINTKVKVEGQKDLAGNAGDAFEFDATLAIDSTPATLSSTSSKMLVEDNTTVTTDEDALYLTFNEPVKVNGDLTLNTKNGIVYTTGNVTAVNEVAGTGFDVDGNGKVEGSEKNTVKVSIDLDSNSTYSFELAAGAVADLTGNKNAETITFNVATGTFQATPGTVTDSLVYGTTPVVVDATNNRVFTVEYAADVTSSATTVANYTLGGKVLPTGTQLQFVNGTKKVRFTLPEGSITANGSYVLEAKNVVDTKGNTLKDGKATTPVVLKESVAPVASKVTVVDSKTFTVDFSEAIADQATVTGLTVKIADASVVPASVVAANGKLTVKTTNDFALTDSIAVEFKSANLFDANKNKVKDGSVSK
ncbi:S-layer homology domain-containing protein [Psychrobacillus sp. INOP01]|uniref:S-layer homology domain-containing protein n=1 Tax=Psychrobacillus sp. INOP01 TaxID=2829187 RepID=UPI001BAB3938|nr:S-layer homology domain-containing protein [Psychrobacillus sp. INOP01]QUG40560.1 S-layer homology domain-containing protein [Psychrobacillus sp. INOP01]